MNWRIVFMPVVILCVAAGQAVGQSGAFLEVTPDARAAALGEAGTALSPDAWSVYWNVAKAAAAVSKTEIAYSYSPWMKDLRENSRLHRVGGYYRLTDKDAVVAGFRHFANGDIGLDEDEVNPGEYAIEAGYARILSEGFSAGATVRYIRSEMCDVQGVDPGNAVGFDVGMYYAMKVELFRHSSDLSFGLTVADIGSRIKYDNSEYALPTRLSAGAALNFAFSEHHRLTAAAAAAWRITPSDSRSCSGGVGVEYGLFDIGFVRSGYHWSDMEKSSGGDYVSFGAGVKYWHLFADFSYRLATEKNDYTDRTLTLSAGFSF